MTDGAHETAVVRAPLATAMRRVATRASRLEMTELDPRTDDLVNHELPRLVEFNEDAFADGFVDLVEKRRFARVRGARGGRFAIGRTHARRPSSVRAAGTELPRLLGETEASEFECGRIV